MIRFAAPLALLVLSCAGPAFAAAEGETPADHPTDGAGDTEAREDKDRKVCRMETRTGSNMPKRVCRTAAQMEADQRAAEQFRDRQNRMGAQAR